MSATRRLRRFFREGEKALPRVGMNMALMAWVLAAAAVTVSAEDMQTEKKGASFRYDPGSHRDPFVPLVRDGKPVGPIKPGGGAIDTTKPVLVGILWDPNGHSMALINDTEVKVGDTVGGYKVAEIRQDAVVLTGGAEPVVLQISFDTAPKPSTGAKDEGGKP